MQIKPFSKISVSGVQLEVQVIKSPTQTAGHTLVFLHEGLGSVAMWRDWRLPGMRIHR